MALYAPILKNTQPAYIPISTEPLRIAWKLSNLDKIDDVKKINIKINEQSTYAQVKGKDATDSKKPTLSGYFVFDAQDYAWGIDTEGWYDIPLSEELFVNPAQFLKNYLYMVQIQLVDEDDNYSEWSNVMITKPITEPTFNITSPSEADSSVYTATALFSTEENLSSANTNFLPSYETLSKYKFDLYENGLLKETSGEILLTNKVSTGELSYTFKYLLEEESSYEVKASYVTTNGFKKTVSKNISVSLPEYNQLTEITLISPTKEDYANFQENAYIGIFAEINAINQGNTYELARAVTGTQFYETIYKFTLEDSQIGKTTLLYKDFTIESGISYSYQIRFGDSVSNTLDLNPIYFEYSYLYADGVQLKLKFNNRINSFKHTVLAAKTDTIGSKYPTISRNGNAYYAEFPITGTISWHMDNDETFFNHKTIDGDNADKLNGYYYKDSLVIPDKLFLAKGIREKTNIGTDTLRSFDTSLTHENIYAERLFRQKVEEFLNNGEYKIFKSPTEGNFIVTLMNISMTPNGQLGRMIYDFSATAYEMQDYNINSLVRYGFLNPAVSNEQTPVIKDYKTSYYAFQYLEDDPNSIVSFETILNNKLEKSYTHKPETNRLKYLSSDGEIISLLQFEVTGAEDADAWYSDENTPVAKLGKTETYILSDIQKLSFENDIYFDLSCRYNFIIQIKTPVSEEDE